MNKANLDIGNAMVGLYQTLIKYEEFFLVYDLVNSTTQKSVDHSKQFARNRVEEELR